jgi:uncharacterized membrane protein YdjX (TVP38/TMEM64 family)
MSALTNLLTQSQDYFLHLGWFGVLLYALAIALLGVLCAPLSPTAVAGGMMFGFGRGFVAITLGTGLAAVLNFLISRYLLRGPIARRLEKNEKFRLIDAAIGREGWKIVGLLRFVPMPFGVANYAYGLTAIPLVPYTLATIVAIIPANAFLTWVGVTAREGVAVATGAGHAKNPGEYVFLALGLVAFFLALRQITKIARNALAKRDAATIIE